MPFVKPGGWRRSIRSAAVPPGTAWTTKPSAHEREEAEDKEREEEEAEWEEERSASVRFDDDGFAVPGRRPIGVHDSRDLGMVTRSPVPVAPIPGGADGSGDQDDENGHSYPGSSHGNAFPAQFRRESKSCDDAIFLAR